MTRTRIALLLSFALVFAAGATLGRLTARTKHPPRRGSWLTEELDLSPQQQEQMRAIWSDVMGQVHRTHGEQRGMLATERDEALRQLLTDEQRQRYEQVLDEYERKLRLLSEQRGAAFQEGVARTKEMLTPDQREKYERMQENMREHRGRRPRRGGPPRMDGRGPSPHPDGPEGPPWAPPGPPAEE